MSEVSEEWAYPEALPGNGIHLGSVDELDDDEVLYCEWRTPGEGCRASTAGCRCTRAGRLVSWTPDFMRRRGDSFPGVMESLIASAVQELKLTVEVISLSGSPLAKDRAGGEAAGTAGSAKAPRG